MPWLANAKYMLAPDLAVGLGEERKPCCACTVPASSFYAAAVESYIFDFEQMLRSGSDDQPGASKEASTTSHDHDDSAAHDSASDIKELLALDSDPEVFDAILAIGFAKMTTWKVSNWS